MTLLEDNLDKQYNIIFWISAMVQDRLHTSSSQVQPYGPDMSCLVHSGPLLGSEIGSKIPFPLTNAIQRTATHPPLSPRFLSSLAPPFQTPAIHIQQHYTICSAATKTACTI